ncbi:hypothetical protein RYH73_11015 [Olivibacter sp. CPCC 100613]|uniref:Crp/Fnr family transcriptional regulator n=1 Tax=Olivibacter sp. CPCC 100613 TaxID=3079931 RepID=UPI002FF87C4F
MYPLLNPFQEELKQLGALSNEAWQALTEIVLERRYGNARAVQLDGGSMLYIGEGFIKQYARAERTQPSIVRFITRGQVLFVPYDYHSIYVKTIERSVLYYWDEYTLRQVITAHPQLLKLYMTLRDMQEQALDHKILLLEEEVRHKLILFNKYQGDLWPYVKNKDLANFLHVSESTLSRSKKDN